MRVLYQDSVLPVIEAGQVELIDGAARSAGLLLVDPTPGHSIGHVAFRYCRAGRKVSSARISCISRSDPSTRHGIRRSARMRSWRQSRRWVLEHRAEQRRCCCRHISPGGLPDVSTATVTDTEVK